MYSLDLKLVIFHLYCSYNLLNDVEFDIVAICTRAGYLEYLATLLRTISSILGVYVVIVRDVTNSQDGFFFVRGLALSELVSPMP